MHEKAFEEAEKEASRLQKSKETMKAYQGKNPFTYDISFS
jgi:hypothetical protein